MSEAQPGWLGALREDTDLSGEIGIRWLDAEERAGMHAGATSMFAALGGDAGWNERGAARLARSVPIALGPERNKRVMKRASSTALFFDPERPEHVNLSLAATMSPLTWAEAPATKAGIRALFARYLGVEAAPVARLPKRFRTLASFGDLDREQLEEALTQGHPMLDDAIWYSAHVEDPWLGEPDMFGIALMAHMRDVRRERGDRIPKVSFRTLFSKSVLTIEQHPFGLWVVDVRYAPAPDASAVHWVNEVFRSRFPDDLPVDLIGSNVLQGGHTSAQEIEEVEARGEIDNFAIAARLALAPGEPETTARLRGYINRFAEDHDRLGFLVNAAAAYGDREAIFEIAARTAGSELSETILMQMKPAVAVPASDEASDEDDDDDDEDDE